MKVYVCCLLQIFYVRNIFNSSKTNFFLIYKNKIATIYAREVGPTLPPQFQFKTVILRRKNTLF